jgi:hypothetical protein
MILRIYIVRTTPSFCAKSRRRRRRHELNNYDCGSGIKPVFGVCVQCVLCVLLYRVLSTRTTEADT